MDIAIDIDICQYAFMNLIAQIEGCCPPLLEEPLPSGEAERLAEAFRALGDPHRLRLLSLIAAKPQGEACVCDLIEPLGLKQPTVSHHLKVLNNAGLLARERRGSWVYYKVLPDRLGVLTQMLGSKASMPEVLDSASIA